jgi:opacity protein-like surface antigen
MRIRNGGRRQGTAIGDRFAPGPVFATIAAAVALLLLLPPAAAQAQNTEVTFAIGALLGDDIDLDLDIIDDARASFDNSPIYGGRVGWYGFPLGVEASVLYSPSGVTTDPAFLTPDETSIMYAEVNALLIIIPGPVAPFVTGGVGVHRVQFTFDEGDLTENAFGWNWGGGIKIKIGPIAVRGDIRDHVTRFESNDVLALLGTENTFHNWEASAGIGVAF